MANDRPVLGIDIAKRKFDVVLLQGQRERHRIFTNDAEGFARLLDWLQPVAIADLHACLEATGHYGEPLARFLHEAGATVSVVNPARIRSFARSELKRNKTDKVDAGCIARFCATQRPLAWRPASAELRTFQRLVHCLQELVQERVRAKNRINDEVEPAAIVYWQRLLAFHDEQIKAMKAEIRAFLAEHPELDTQFKLLKSIPAIGEMTALALMTQVPDWTQFSCARKVVAFAGLNPSEFSSGSSVRGKTRISRTGSSRLRFQLYMPAVVALSRNPITKAMAMRMKEAGKPSMVIVVAIMRKLLHLAFGVLKTGKPFDPAHVTT
jgi:transposase